LSKARGFGISWHMIKRCASLGTFLALAWSLHAATLKLPSLTVGPVTYTNVNVIGANATDLYFTHEHGIGNVKLKYLSPDLQKQFHYDPNAAAAEEKKQAEADALYHSMVASNITAQVEKTRAAQVIQEPETFADPISDKSLLGKQAPRFEFDKWIGDKPSTEGKSVLLLFWAPSSKASCRSIPELNAFQKKFADKLAVIGVTQNPDPDAISQLKEAKPQFPVASDDKQKVAQAASITSIPCVLLVDTKGVVRYQGHPAALSEKAMQNFLAQSAE